MHHARLFVALIVVLSVFPAGVGADIRGYPVLDATLSDNTVTPGEETTLQVDITNAGRVSDGSAQNPQRNDRVTTARGLTVELDEEDAPIDVKTNTQAVGTLGETSVQVGFDIVVAPDAEPGSYTLTAETQYSYTRDVSVNGDEEQVTRERPLDVTLEIDNEASVSVVDIETDARVGSTGTTAVTVENTGTMTARDAVLRLESGNGDITFGGGSSATRSLGSWETGERRTVEYETTAAASARSQQYAVDLSATYDDEDGLKRTTDTETVSITPLAEQTFSVRSTDSAVPVDGSGTLTVEMRNDGPIPVTDARVALTASSPDVSFGGSDTANRFVGRWEPGENRTIEVDATASEDAETRSYTVDASVSYQDREGDSETAPTRSLGLMPDPEQSFSVGDVESTLAVGAEGTLRGTVTNTGDTEVRNGVVRFASTKPTVTAIETESPIGDLSPGESAAFSIPLEISESAEAGPQQYALAVQYRDSEGDQRESDTIDVRQDVGPDEPVFSLSTENGTVAPGEGTQIRVTITNEESETVTDISANLFADDPISADDDEAFIGRLEPGESRELLFSVSASGGALAKDYPVEIDFQYDEADGDTVVSDTYKQAISVAEREDGGGLPIVPILVAVVVIGAGLLVYRRRFA